MWSNVCFCIYSIHTVFYGCLESALISMLTCQTSCWSQACLTRTCQKQPSASTGICKISSSGHCFPKNLWRGVWNHENSTTRSPRREFLGSWSRCFSRQLLPQMTQEGLASYSSSITAGSCQACPEQVNNDDFVIYYENQQRNSAQVPQNATNRLFKWYGCSAVSCVSWYVQFRGNWDHHVMTYPSCPRHSHLRDPFNCRRPMESHSPSSVAGASPNSCLTQSRNGTWIAWKMLINILNIYY